MSDEPDSKTTEKPANYNQPNARPPILVVEDEIDLAEEIGDALGALGFRIVYAKAYGDALLKLTNERFSCVVLDINLEKGTGDKLVPLIRTNPHHLNHRTPIIVASGHLNRDLVTEMAGSIQAAYVKPYKIEELIAKISALAMAS